MHVEVSKVETYVTWVSWERGACTAWQCADMGLEAGGTCVRQLEEREWEHTINQGALLIGQDCWKVAECL